MTDLSGGNPALDALLSRLPAGLRRHVVRAGEKAAELAAMHNVDPRKAGLAALAHDIARGMKEGELLEMARSFGLALHPVEEAVAVLAHGPVGAELLRRECGIDDPETLEAVRWHSTFNRGLGPVAKVVFLADKLDPGKAGRYSSLDRIERLAREDMDAAILSLLQEDLASMLEKGMLIHPASIEGRNELLGMRAGGDYGRSQP